MGIIHTPKQSYIHINKYIITINHHLCNKIVPFGVKIIVVFNKNIIKFYYGIVNASNLTPITFNKAYQFLNSIITILASY